MKQTGEQAASAHRVKNDEKEDCGNCVACFCSLAADIEVERLPTDGIPAVLDKI